MQLCHDDREVEFCSSAPESCLSFPVFESLLLFDPLEERGNSVWFDGNEEAMFKLLTPTKSCMEDEHCCNDHCGLKGLLNHTHDHSWV